MLTPTFNLSDIEKLHTLSIPSEYFCLKRRPDFHQDQTILLGNAKMINCDTTRRPGNSLTCQQGQLLRSMLIMQ